MRSDPVQRNLNSGRDNPVASPREPIDQHLTKKMSGTRPTTVLVADDHAIVMEGLVSLLRDHDFDVVGAVGDGEKLLEAARRLKPDVIVADLSMPGMSGLEALIKLKAERSESKVIVLTMHRDAQRATQAIRAGASGFLLKESAGEELVAAIHQALEGHVYLTAAVTKAVIAQMATSPTGRPAPELTPRQLDVLRLIVKGYRMKEIATVLKLSTRTVEAHKYEMMQVLELHSTAELVRYALEQNIVVD
jgi:DNA-binding NarL/FixJ family response regulator